MHDTHICENNTTMADVFNDMEKYVNGKLGPTMAEKPTEALFTKAKRAAEMPWAHVAATFVIVIIMLSVVNPGFIREKQTPEEKRRMEPAQKSLIKMVSIAFVFAVLAGVIPFVVSHWDKITSSMGNMKSSIMSIKNKLV